MGGGWARGEGAPYSPQAEPGASVTHFALRPTGRWGRQRCGQVSSARSRFTRPLSSQAQTSGKFSREELDKLWREFQHHREKVREYNVLLETLSRTEGASCSRPSLWAALTPKGAAGRDTLLGSRLLAPFSEGDRATWEGSPPVRVPPAGTECIVPTGRCSRTRLTAGQRSRGRLVLTV